MNLNIFGKIDRTLFISVLILLSIGLIIILSTSYSSAGIDLMNFKKQLIFSFIGIFLMIAVSFFDYRSLKNYTGVLYIVSCLVLIIILSSGAVVRGTTSWFDFGYFNFQPSEIVTIIIVIIMAKYLSKNAYFEDI